MTPYYDDGNGIVIFLGDCREILPTLKPVELWLVDPPYGIDWQGSNASTRQWEGIEGDTCDGIAEWIISQLPEDQSAVIWGANCFPRLLPHRGRWCCWDKRCDERADKMLGRAFELAWENRNSGFDMMVRVQHGGVVNADHKRFGRSHPTQKPVALQRAIIERYNAQTIIDLCMGSGTTLRAAKDLGRDCIGIELEERYCEIAAKRLEQAVLPGFHDPPEPVAKPQVFDFQDSP